MASDWSKLRLILHIGPHKTGTTSLQQALLNRYGAEEPAAIWYPIPQRPGPGHAILAAEIINDGQPSLSSAIRAASQGNCDTLIVSSEIDWGQLGNAEVFQWRGTVGAVWDHVEVYAGYRYYELEGVALDGLIVGLRTWF